MMQAGVPVVPGSKEPVYTAEDGLVMAKEIGFPVMIKASSGGGGKGMRISRSEEDFTEHFNAAQLESVKGFSDDTMYIEKYIEKHVMWNFRSWVTNLAMLFTWENVTAPSSAVIRR